MGEVSWGMPKVRIGIPTFNRCALLRDAIQSVLAQTYVDFVLEIADNASTDRTPEVVASFDDPRIVYLRRPENVGLLAQYKHFLAEREAEYLLIVSDDDLLYPRYLETAVHTLDRNLAAGLVHTAFDLLGPSGEVIAEGNWTGGLSSDTVESPERFLRESMKWSCRVCQSTALIRTTAIPEGGMKSADFPAGDFGLWLRIAAAGWDILFLGDRFAAYRVHGDSVSANQVGAPQDGSYSLDIDTVNRVRDVKLRFIAEQGPRIRDPEELRRLVRWGTHYQIASMVRRRTLAREDVALRRLRFIAEAARIDRTVIRSDTFWRYLAADLLKRVPHRRAQRWSHGSA